LLDILPLLLIPLPNVPNSSSSKKVTLFKCGVALAAGVPKAKYKMFKVYFLI
jgi:hypothetical protein